ncbi:MAG: FecR domain-containing protein [Alphaproteobacteria bacterium]|nr:FecR domain-containing protein [Alphaproteobacteria bacterium]
MNTKEWLAAIGALSASLNTADAQEPGRAGVAAAVNTTTSGRLGDNSRTLFIGNDVFKDERISTDANGRAQLLFLDQSAVTVGPGAELVIDRFVYDERTKLGTLAVQASRGLIRFVGGDISKATDVVVRTPTALIGIRGGVALINVDANGGTNAIFVFGTSMTVTANQGGQTQTVIRPGFGVTVAPAAGGPTTPIRVPGSLLTALLAQLEAPNPPGTLPASGPGIVPLPRQVAPDRILQRIQTIIDSRTPGATQQEFTDKTNQQTMRQTLSNQDAIRRASQLRGS